MSRYDLRRLADRGEVVTVGKELAAEIKNDDVASLAAAVAFKIVLALFPALLAAVGLFGLVTDPAELQSLLDQLAAVAPSGVVAFLDEQVLRPLITRNAASGLALIVGVGVGLWAASSAAVTLNRALTRANDMVDRRKLVRARVTGLVVTAALFVALVTIFVLLVVGGALENTVLGSLNLNDTARSVADLVSTILRYLAALVALMLLFAFIYWVGPDFRVRRQYPWISPGAVLGVVTWLVASGVFSVYVTNFGNYTGENSIYGTLGNAILFMLWLQISMFALLLGAEVNQVLRLRVGKRDSARQIVGFGGEPAPQRAPAETPDGGTGAAHGDVAAATTPGASDSARPSRAALAVSAGTTTAGPRHGDVGGDGAGAPTDTGPGGRNGELAGSRVQRHGRATAGQAGEHRHDRREPLLPPDTAVGAAVAAAASVAGVIGLLVRRRRS